MPEKVSERQFNIHNVAVTLMRTTPDECAAIGKGIATRVATSTGPATIFLPLLGVSAIDEVGEPFDGPEAREALFVAIRENRGAVDVVELPYHINDPRFAEAAARRLLDSIRQEAPAS